MIPNGQEIIIDGHKVVFESEPSSCRGCFFENRDSCPDCDEGIWVEEGSPWHTGTPTEDGEYLVICQYVVDNYYYQEKLVWEFENGYWKNKQRFTEELKIIAWYGQKIEPYKETD